MQADKCPENNSNEATELMKFSTVTRNQ